MSLRRLTPDNRGRASESSHTGTEEHTQAAGDGASGAQPDGSLGELEEYTQLADRPRWRRFLDGTLGSIKMRLTVLTSLVVIFSIAIITFAAYATVSQILWQSTDSLLRSQAQSIIEMPEDKVPGAQQGERYDPAFEDISNTMRLMVVPESNTGIAAPVAKFEPFLDNSEIEVIKGEHKYSFRSDGDDRYFAVAAPDGRVVVLISDTSATTRALEPLALVLTMIAICGALGSIVMVTAVVTTGLQPIARLRRATDRVTETGQLHQLSVFSQDEVGALTNSFNNMMLALQASREKQKELVADASHELKTPLTSLRTNIELLLLASREDTPSISDEDRREIERDVMGQLDEMSALIGDLVDLAREDGPALTRETVDLEDRLMSSVAKAQRRRPDVTFEIHSEHWITQGDPLSLDRALLNLLDNAAKWSPENGTVRVWMQPICPNEAHIATVPCEEGESPEAVEIRVADSGPGIPPEDRAKVFDRFYRSIQSRSMPGSGLGLSIVKQVVESHGGAIVADESDDGGALIRVVLPGHRARAQEIEAAGERRGQGR